MLLPQLPRVRSTRISVIEDRGIDPLPWGYAFESEDPLTSTTRESSLTATTSPRTVSPAGSVTCTTWPEINGANSFHFSSSGWDPACADVGSRKNPTAAGEPKPLELKWN